ncbi:MAG: extracellular solute-binding protein [Chloroflexota bacterium]
MSYLRRNQKRSMTTLILILMAVVLSACQAQTVEVTRVVTEVETVTEEVEVMVTPTPAPEESFAGVTIEGIMRNSFIPAMNAIQANQAEVWGEETQGFADLTFSREWREQVAASIDSGAGGDISELFANQAFIYGDQLLDVSDIAEELADQYGGWYELAAEASVVDGVWRAIPRAYTAQAINFRTDVFEEAGIEKLPETYDELLEAARIIHEAGLPPAGFTMNQAGPNDSANFAYSLLWSYGGSEVLEDGCTVAINSDGTRAALEYMIELGQYMAPDVTAYDEGGNNRAFLAGEISMTQNATSIYWVAQQQAPDIAANIGHFKYPSGPNGRQEFVQINLLAIPAHTDNPEAAKNFLRWMMQEEQLSPLAQVGLTFYTPLLRSYDDAPTMPWNIDPVLEPLKGAADGGHLAGWPGPASRESAAAYENQTIVNMFASVLTGTDIETAVENAEAELNAVYSCN